MPQDSAAVREHIVRALHADLIGPFALDAPDDAPQAREELPLPPTRWYLTGFLVPESDAEEEGPQDDEMDAGDAEDDEDSTTEKPDPTPKRRLPASLGISVLLPPGSASETIAVSCPNPGGCG